VEGIYMLHCALELGSYAEKVTNEAIIVLLELSFSK